MPLRLRLALVLAAATAAVLLGGGWLFTHRLQSSLLHGVDGTLTTRADDIAAALTNQGSAPTGLLEGKRTATTTPRRNASEAQILDDQGDVLSSTTADTDPLVTAAELARARTAGPDLYLFTVGHKRDEGDRVAILPVTRGASRYTVVAMTGLDNVDDAVDRVERQLAVAAGPLVVLAGLAGWWLAGAALRPVERMRRQVADLQEDDLGPSLDVPRSRDEVARLARTMNELLARVRRARRSERGFVAEAGHELRTPLAILRGELELASRPGRSAEDLRAALVVATEETDRLSRLAEDLLLLARGDDHAMPFHPRPTDVADIVARSVAAATPRANDRHVSLRVDDRGAGPVDVDPDRYRQAIDNLIDNAIRYAPAGSTVVAALAREAGEVRCVVHDDGPGFPPEFLGRALERFAKAEDQRNGGGAGLGLAIVATIARAHRGRAWVANRPEGGGEAAIAVPVGDGQAGNGETGGEPAEDEGVERVKGIEPS